MFNSDPWWGTKLTASLRMLQKPTPTPQTKTRSLGLYASQGIAILSPGNANTAVLTMQKKVHTQLQVV